MHLIERRATVAIVEVILNSPHLFHNSTIRPKRIKYHYLLKTNHINKFKNFWHSTCDYYRRIGNKRLHT